jgi:hypothetical protein
MKPVLRQESLLSKDNEVYRKVLKLVLQLLNLLSIDNEVYKNVMKPTSQR